jgi:hypothetical protein
MKRKFDNWCGDNLSDPDEDDDDENECYNWSNNPIRALFDNPRQVSHPSMPIVTRQSQEPEESKANPDQSQDA